MTVTTDQKACPRCNTALPAGAQFCGACGASTVAGAPPPQPAAPPRPATPPPMPQMARGFSGASSGGASQQATFTGDPADAFASALQAIAATNGQITWQQSPTAARFLLTRKSWWSTGGVTIKYDGDLAVQRTSASDVTARFGLKVQWNSYIPLALTQVIAIVILAMMNYYTVSLLVWLLLLAAGIGYSAWTVSSSVPDKALGDIIKNLHGGAPAQAPAAYAPPPAAAAAVAPQPAPTPQAAAPSASSPAAGDTATIVEQIKQLAGLRDAGAITVEEFEAKKAELLKRI